MDLTQLISTAKTSVLNFKHSAAILYKGKILPQTIVCNEWMCHAEINSINKLMKIHQRFLQA